MMLVASGEGEPAHSRRRIASGVAVIALNEPDALMCGSRGGRATRRAPSVRSSDQRAPCSRRRSAPRQTANSDRLRMVAPLADFRRTADNTARSISASNSRRRGRFCMRVGRRPSADLGCCRAAPFLTESPLAGPAPPPRHGADHCPDAHAGQRERKQPSPTRTLLADALRGSAPHERKRTRCARAGVRALRIIDHGIYNGGSAHARSTRQTRSHHDVGR
jgi:hypothetical protein